MAEMSFCQTRCSSNPYQFCFCLKSDIRSYGSYIFILSFLYSTVWDPILKMLLFSGHNPCLYQLSSIMKLNITFMFIPALRLSNSSTLCASWPRNWIAFFLSSQTFRWEKHPPTQHDRIHQPPLLLGDLEEMEKTHIKTLWNLFPVPAIGMDTSKPEVVSTDGTQYHRASLNIKGPSDSLGHHLFRSPLM